MSTISLLSGIRLSNCNSNGHNNEEKVLQQEPTNVFNAHNFPFLLPSTPLCSVPKIAKMSGECHKFNNSTVSWAWRTFVDLGHGNILLISAVNKHCCMYYYFHRKNGRAQHIQISLVVKGITMTIWLQVNEKLQKFTQVLLGGVFCVCEWEVI